MFKTYIIILSYLLWSGMRAVSDALGPDHILYPAVSGQPVFRFWLNEKEIAKLHGNNNVNNLGIPSFSNSFVAIVPEDLLDKTIELIKQSIMDDWNNISLSVFTGLEDIGLDTGLKNIWKREADKYWVFRYASSPWIMDFDDYLLAETSFDRERSKQASGLFNIIYGYRSTLEFLYLPSHELSQNRHHKRKMAMRSKERESVDVSRCTMCNKKSQLDVNEDEKK